MYIFNLNLHRICNKMDTFIAPMEVNDYDLNAITETWLESDQGWKFNIPGYLTLTIERQNLKGYIGSLAIKGSKENGS